MLSKERINQIKTRADQAASRPCSNTEISNLCDMALACREAVEESSDPKDVVLQLRTHQGLDRIDGVMSIKYNLTDTQAAELITAFTTSQLLQKGQKEVVWEGVCDSVVGPLDFNVIQPIAVKSSKMPTGKYIVTISTSGSKVDEPSVSALQSPGASGQGDGGDGN